MSSLPRAVLSVSTLTTLIRTHIETAFADIWVEGEVSNLRIPSSGHAYFTLKDAHSQLKTVMFRSSNRWLRFSLKDGMCLICRGRLTIYEPKGDYQIIVEYAEPKGAGALQVAFEQLKERLAAEGLFHVSRKRPLPVFPRRLGVVTSSTGAALRDIIQVSHKRFPGVEILVNPVAVQGTTAASEIAHAIAELNDFGDIDVIIIGRGGGSLEDLWCFNEEVVARAIAASRIPIVSAVGHEIDYTIADFVADVRAPTPSAAVELVVRDRLDVLARVQSLWDRQIHALRVRVRDCRTRVMSERRALLDPVALVHRSMQRRDDLDLRLSRAMVTTTRQARSSLDTFRHRLLAKSPLHRIDQALTLLTHLGTRLEQGTQTLLTLCGRSLQEALGGLHALSPLAILSRGYSITRRWPDMTVLRRAADAAHGELLHVRLASGELICEVKQTGEDLQAG